MVQARTIEKAMKEAGISKKQMEIVLSKVTRKKRQPPPPKPEGSISQSEGARKYGVPQTTIATWVRDGYLPIVLRTGREVYVDETRLSKLSKCRKPGRGRKRIPLKFNPITAS